MRKVLFGNEITFYDLETLVDANVKKEKSVRDIGAFRGGKEFHDDSLEKFGDFIKGSKFLCGHNIFQHDNYYIKNITDRLNISSFIDTLLLSPLLDPYKPYHYLIKDDNIVGSRNFNDPLSDSKGAAKLLEDFIDKYKNLNKNMQKILYFLLHEHIYFKSFFEFINVRFSKFGINLSNLIKREVGDKICINAPIDMLIDNRPIELAYTLMLFSQYAEQKKNIDWLKVKTELDDGFVFLEKPKDGDVPYVLKTPAWVLRNFPKIEEVVHILRGVSCKACKYCKNELDEVKSLNKFFGYENFRQFDGKNLQHEAVKAATEGESILVIFPTAGGKSLTFQLPALIAGHAENSLTVVISPLQSLMKDQIDVLEKEHNIFSAVTINGLQDVVERKNAIERIEKGSANILYISPEKLRSQSTENLLLRRHIARFVIDEAHCLSSWGHDFRVDYQHIGKFIKTLQAKKGGKRIPVSCFTATAKVEVSDEIKKYFKKTLNLELREISADTRRKNLSYFQISVKDNADKFDILCNLLKEKRCPTIVYVARVQRANDLAQKLCGRDFKARAYNAKMDSKEKAKNQDDFKEGNIDIIVATTAFGMGVDKSDVGMVVHYNISDSLENYAQESGRAGRDPKITADCYIIYNEDDLNDHFSMLNHTKLSLKEIKDIWKAVKNITKDKRRKFSMSAIEIAKRAGWDLEVNKSGIETKVTTAINALEQGGFLERGYNAPRIFADSILVNSVMEARKKLENSKLFKDDKRKDKAMQILGSLLGSKNINRKKTDTAESRVDYIAENRGFETQEVMDIVTDLRTEEILGDSQDLVIDFSSEGLIGQKREKLKRLYEIEKCFLSYLKKGTNTYDLREINEEIQKINEKASIVELQKVVGFLSIAGYIKTERAGKRYSLKITSVEDDSEYLIKHLDRRLDISNTLLSYLNELDRTKPTDKRFIEVSTKMLVDHYNHNLLGDIINSKEVEEALLYLSRVDILSIEGGFLVLYNAMQIERIEYGRDYLKSDYAKLEEFYENRKRQIHFVGEYAGLMKEDMVKAKEFERDYFTLESKEFEKKYYKGRQKELKSSITPKKYEELFSDLSEEQLEIIEDKDSQYIVVAAGPGSGKTRILTRKLASLSLLEDVKSEHLLMLTFSRAAVNDFKEKLTELLKEQAKYIQIKTFHSYCFDLLGRPGNINDDKIIAEATEKIRAGEVDTYTLNKKTLVIDEAQDMNEEHFGLIEALIEQNEDMRVIAVGDDDQCIFQFNDANPQLFGSLLLKEKSQKYELVDNYRSYANLVSFSNQFIAREKNRLKKTAIKPVNKVNGNIQVIEVESDNIEGAVADAVLSTNLSGTTCIATRTNQEVNMITSLLVDRGRDASRVQSMMQTNISCYKLVEIRAFLDYIVKLMKEETQNEISEDFWNNAKQQISRVYKSSKNLDILENFFKGFEKNFPNEKYKDDLLEFAREVSIEDLSDIDENKIFVSTIHKIKGREFDNMFIMLGESFPERLSAEDNKLIYVALTRAKKNMCILCKRNPFIYINVDNLKRYKNNKNYELPREITLRFTYSDVHLGYFDYEPTQRKINKLKSGDKLYCDVDGEKLFYRENSNKNDCIYLSSAKQKEVKELMEKGYVMHQASIKDIVYWIKDKDLATAKEIKVILPELTLKLKDKVESSTQLT